MSYKIGEVSKLLDIPVETIRYYESKNIISPKRAKDSNYREYETWDIYYLLECKKFRSYSLPIEEIINIIHHESLEYFCEKITKVQHEIENKIKYYTLLHKKNQKYQDTLVNIKKKLNQYTIKNRSESLYLLMNAREDSEYGRIYDNDGLFKAWIKYFPFIDVAQNISKQDINFRDEINRDNWFLGMEKEYADALELPINQSVIYKKEQKCIYTIVCVGDRGSLSLKILDGAIKYIEDNGYKIVDDIIGNLLARVHEDDKYYRYIELWIPIE
ncbi:MerR family transcriptional regulator [Clostridium felsineum]|uniref:MerR family transcriptional regulator n=1 Tax=Clostridium felsineum TaxID=36839 RepID=UPI00098CB1C3|nr:MerR family transcriptional regulator [Clostridium felsineum]URZ15654.1 hypothetical protein CLFE_017000 [Clostridium felsineum DSM 794]